MKKYIVDDGKISLAQEREFINMVSNATPITSDEAIARAYEWLNDRQFKEFMEWWKFNDYPTLVYANLDEECENFIVARESYLDNVIIVRWGL